jgi:hypothetical protein
MARRQSRETRTRQAWDARPPSTLRQVASELGQEIDRPRRSAGLLPLEFPVDQRLLDQDGAPAHVPPLQRKRLLRP